MKFKVGDKVVTLINEVVFKGGEMYVGDVGTIVERYKDPYERDCFGVVFENKFLDDGKAVRLLFLDDQIELESIYNSALCRALRDQNET